MKPKLQGSLCHSPNTCTAVPYLSFVDPTGVTALQNALTTAIAADASSTASADKIVVFGYSDGATVVGKWLTQHLNDPDMPPPDVLSFVVIGNPTRAFGGLAAPNGVVWPQSDYQVIDVSQQYDGVSDFPTNTASPYYLLAVMNAAAGFWTLHLNYSKVDINDPANAVWTSPDGNITYVLVPTQNLPLLGVSAFLFPGLNARLKEDIETAYTRPVPFPTMTQPTSPASLPPAAFAQSTSVVFEPTVPPTHTAVPLSPALTPLAKTTGSVPTVTGSNEIDGTVTGAPPAADTDAGGPSAADALTTASLPDAGDQAAAVEKFRPPAAKQRRHRAPAAAQSTTGPTTHTRTVDHRMATPR
ncbi:MAG TPA: PE-PPE domain-containing protein [Mycobacterium sp.]